MVQPALQYALSAREYDFLRAYLVNISPEKAELSKSNLILRPPSRHHDHHASAFRSAFRLFIGIEAALKSWDVISTRFLARKSSKSSRSVAPLVVSDRRLALAFSTLVFFHRILFRFFTRLRLRLLKEKARRIRERYPKLFAALTSRVAPIVGASVSGFALGIYPASQLRVLITIYVGQRSLEFLYNALDGVGYFKNKPWWVGSWMFSPIAQGQLLHAFVFDRDCFPQEYGEFILRYTPDYIQKRPAGLSNKVVWPSSNQIVNSLAAMATLCWPPFISPIINPVKKDALPRGIDAVISPITSRAHPAIQNLSCALLHPSEPSCFTAYLQHNIKSFPQLARFFTFYYSALSLLRIRAALKSPVQFINNLAKQILKTTAAVSGAIGGSWGSICLFAAILPRTFLPRFRFFLGGLLGGCFQFLDRGAAGHANAMYAARSSVHSLWKVGVKHGWWKGVKGGDLLLCIAAGVLAGVVYEFEGERVVDRMRGKLILKIMRGEADIGFANEKDEAGEQLDTEPKDDSVN